MVPIRLIFLIPYLTGIARRSGAPCSSAAVRRPSRSRAMSADAGRSRRRARRNSPSGVDSFTYRSKSEAACWISGFAPLRVAIPNWRDQVEQASSRPADRIAPTFDAPEFSHHVDPRQGLDVVKRHSQRPPPRRVFDAQRPLRRIESVVRGRRDRSLAACERRLRERSATSASRRK